MLRKLVHFILQLEVAAARESPLPARRVPGVVRGQRRGHGTQTSQARLLQRRVQPRGLPQGQDGEAAQLQDRVLRLDPEGALPQVRQDARKRNDGTEYFAVEFVYVEESEQDFATTMLSAAEAALAHEGAHFWFVRTRDVALYMLKHAPSFAELAGRLGKSQEEAMQALLSTTHENHLTFTDDDEKKKIDHARC